MASLRLCLVAALLFGTYALPSVAAPPNRKPHGPATTPAAPGELGDVLTGEAKEQYELAKGLYRSGDYAGALAKFQRAHDLQPDARLLWNMASCERKLDHYVKAIALVDEYVASAGPLLTEADRQVAAEFVRAVQGYVSTVTIDASEPGLAVFLDGAQVGTTPLDKPLSVDLGDHTFRFSKSGFKELTVAQRIPGGTAVTLPVRPTPEPHEAHVIVSAAPKDVISFDGSVVAQQHWSAVVASGPHSLVVSGDGKRSKQFELTLADHETRNVTVALESEGTWLGRNWPWLAGGVAVLGGGVVASYFLLRPGTPTQREGTLPGYQLP